MWSLLHSGDNADQENDQEGDNDDHDDDYRDTVEKLSALYGEEEWKNKSPEKQIFQRNSRISPVQEEDFDM